MLHTIDLSRRSLLAGGAAAMAAAGMALRPPQLSAQEAAALPEYVEFKTADALIVHSDNTIETRREAFGARLITPETELYIRNNVAPPSAAVVADRDAWEVEIQGVVNAGTLTVGALKTMGLERVAMVLQCSGNGRSYFDHETSGTQWQVGAAGNVIWTGVPLRQIVDALGGLENGVNFITSTGGEELPEGVDPNDIVVERSVPITTLDTVLLAWELNDAPISLAHGGPLRLIVPGYTGVNSVKYVKRVAFTANETEALIQASRYRLHPVGQEGGPEHASVWEMGVKSWITAPLAGGRAGRAHIIGVAFGGINALGSVEASVDGGATWSPAELISPDLGRYAWRTFVLPTEFEPGSYRLVSRATDSEGNAQPQAPEPNDGGYNHNGWEAPGVDITVG